jgi:hypothetical protein
MEANTPIGPNVEVKKGEVDPKKMDPVELSLYQTELANKIASS